MAYYTTDDFSRENFKELIGKINPMHESAAEEDLQDHVYEFVNRHKICDVKFSGFNWRDIGYNIFGKVDSRILLYVENINAIQFSYNNEYEYVEDVLKQKTGFLNKASQALEAVRLMSDGGKQTGNSNGKFVSKYSKLPAWKGSTGLTGMNQLTFKFRFGQAGLFDAWEEVVKPVLALGSTYAPYFASGNYMQGPLPTIQYYLINMGRHLLGDIKAAAAEGFASLIPENPFENKEPKSDNGVAKMQEALAVLTNLQRKIYEAVDSAIADTLAQSNLRSFYFTVGEKLSMGPFTAKGASMSFDFTQVDERGYPYQGSVTLNGMETYLLANAWTIQSMFGQKDAVKTQLEDDAKKNSSKKPTTIDIGKLDPMDSNSWKTANGDADPTKPKG
jgi:hypothetical protein